MPTSLSRRHLLTSSAAAAAGAALLTEAVSGQDNPAANVAVFCDGSTRVYVTTREAAVVAVADSPECDR